MLFHGHSLCWTQLHPLSGFTVMRLLNHAVPGAGPPMGEIPSSSRSSSAEAAGSAPPPPPPPPPAEQMRPGYGGLSQANGQAQLPPASTNPLLSLLQGMFPIVLVAHRVFRVPVYVAELVVLKCYVCCWQCCSKVVSFPGSCSCACLALEFILLSLHLVCGAPDGRACFLGPPSKGVRLQAQA